MPFVDIPQSGIDASRGGYIAFAGRFAEEKGIQVFLDAAKLSGLPCRFCRNQDHIVRVKLPEGVTEVVTGSRAELNAFYRGARMLVFPSIWFETFGLVGAEAMGHGLPVVTPNFGALADLVEDEISGLLFRTGDAADLAAKMTRLWEDGDLCRRMGLAARERAIAHWTVDHYFEQLASLYDEVILEMRNRS
jgi:glycosyltransferase involved in cell wall biosynthesis